MTFVTVIPARLMLFEHSLGVAITPDTADGDVEHGQVRLPGRGRAGDLTRSAL